jgi:uncharacterized membrane protein
MAGIGFELKRLFSQKGLISNLRANLYASVVVAGPMILGALLLFLLRYIAIKAGASLHQQDIFIIVTVYSMLFPLLLTSFLSNVLTRFVADMFYEENYERILPSMNGAISICLLLGVPGWLIFLNKGAAPFEYNVFSLTLFCEATVVWIQMTYISMTKDYMSIVRSFGLGILCGILCSLLFIWVFHFDIVLSSLAATCIAYGVMLIGFTFVLHSYFPIGHGSALKFLGWLEKYPALMLVGIFSMLGLFIHLILMWSSPWGEKVVGLFYQAPFFDLPALLAFFTTLVTTVNFVTSVEVNFYPKYRLYFSLLNESGSLADINEAYKEMIIVLKQELFYLAQIQLLVVIISIGLSGIIIPLLGSNFTSEMIGLFRVMCLGYGLFAISNSIMLFLLYFSDYQGALLAVSTLLVVNVVGTLYTLQLSSFFYGFGFLFASFGMFIIAWWKLSDYIDHLDFNIFCKQPVFIAEKNGWLTRLSRRLDGTNK